MEKRDRPYSVKKYDPLWIKKYEIEKDILQKIFGSIALKIEHVGSTSVPGMWAKPQIDILIVVKDFSWLENKLAPMTSAGYIFHRKDFDKYNDAYFSRDNASGERIVSIHIRLETDPQSVSQIYFRDYLRSHPTEQKLYSDTKLSAYAEGGVDLPTYVAGKKNTLLELLNRAKNWYEANLT